MRSIVQKEDLVLRKVASPVPPEEISSKKIEMLLDEMKATLATQNDGVALAAPQIGESLRIFVVSEKAFEDSNAEKKGLVFINPEIIKRSKKKKWIEEGCLSVRPLYGKTHRSEKTTVRAYDENGTVFTYGGSGLLSQIFQHEVDHLNGILFIDHAKGTYELMEEETQLSHE